MGNSRATRNFESPMRAVDSALLDPFLESRDLGCAHRLGLALLSLRHEIFRIFRLDSLDQLALLRMIRDDRVATALALLHRPLSEIEPQACLAHFRVRTVTTKTSAGQDRLYILIEIEASRNLRSIATDSAHCESHNNKTKTGACRLAGITNRLSGRITAGCGM